MVPTLAGYHVRVRAPSTSKQDTLEGKPETADGHVEYRVARVIRSRRGKCGLGPQTLQVTGYQGVGTVLQLNSYVNIEFYLTLQLIERGSYFMSKNKIFFISVRSVS